MAFQFVILTASGTWPVPADLQPGTLAVWCTGEGGNSGSSVSGSGGHSAGGGGGGGIGGEPNYGGVTPGTTVLTVTIGTGGTGTDTTVTGGTGTVTGKHGANGSGLTGGLGGAASGSTVSFPGGNGGNGLSGANKNGGSGGGSAGSTGGGGNGGTASAGGTAGTGAAGPPSLAGAAGASFGSPAQPGIAPGSGAGGAGNSIGSAGANGARGQVIIIWQTQPVSSQHGAQGPMHLQQGHAHGQQGAPPPMQPAPPRPIGHPVHPRPFEQQGHAHGEQGAPAVPFTPGGPAAPFYSPEKPERGAELHQAGHAHGQQGHLTVVPAHVVNQWGATFARPASFQNMPPALSDVVIPLTPAASVGPGSGTPTAGNWLFVTVGWNQQTGTPPVTVGVTDDIDSWYRPTAPSPATSSTATRTKVEYTPNLERVPAAVYASVTGAVDGMAVTVFEVTGLGPWDLVTVAPYSAYAAGATSLPLTLGSPSQQSFIVAAACGDNSAALQSLTAGGYTTLSTVTASNGVDHSADTVLTSLCGITSNAVSIAASASTPEDLSGAIISVAVTGPSPITPGGNSAWALLKFESGFGSGFETPPDQITWTDLTKRLLAWHETSGVQYQMGQILSTTLDLNLRNWEGALSPGNASSPYYPDVTAGTPLRLRCALGPPVNRWYIISRNALKWPEQRSPRTLLGYVPAAGTDIWSVCQATCPSPYRGEVYQDLAAGLTVTGLPGWWYPCDDQPLGGGVLPTSLRNAAPGNTVPLQILLASTGGAGPQDVYSPDGTDLTALGGAGVPDVPPTVAVYTVGADSGWMYGDPQSQGSSAASEGGAVTSSPGAAAWQQTGLAGTGTGGWFLSVNDPTFPALSSGVTVEGWWNVPFAGTSAGVLDAAVSPTVYKVTGQQPYGPMTLLSLATDTAPVAALQLDTSGHLTFGSAPGSGSTVYGGSDLRCGSWFHVAIVFTGTATSVYVNGSLTATGTGFGAMGPAFTWLTACGDYGSGGGRSGTPGHGGNMSVSGLRVTPLALPLHRIMSTYNAAMTGFGAVPAPTSLSISTVADAAGTQWTPDGTLFNGHYAYQNNGSNTYYPWSFSLVAAAQLGTYRSGPSARAVAAGHVRGDQHFGEAIWTQYQSTAPAVNLYTSATGGTESDAAGCLGSGNSWYSGYGATASGDGVSQYRGGTGAAPPTAPDPLGDTVQERILRLLGYIGATFPLRSIDPSPPLVQAALDTAGQPASQGIDNIRQSDSGFLSVGRSGALRYRMRSRLAADQVAWQLTSNATPGAIPYLADQSWDTDSQRIWNDIRIRLYSPDGANLPDRTPVNAAAVRSSQAQYGTRPLALTSYLQSAAEQQAQADWYLAQFGVQRRRCAVITVDAAPMSGVLNVLAWQYVLSVQATDLVHVTDQPVGQGVTVGTYRVTQVIRDISFGANGAPVVAKAQCVLDFEPSSYFS